MHRTACVTFLQWLLPKLNMRWQGFRKVKRQVCRRIDRRISELCLNDIESYRTYLEQNPEEWEILDHFCRITISRFYRDRSVFDFLGKAVLPALGSRFFNMPNTAFRAWSTGCASGEEPYTLAILWNYSFQEKYPDVRPEIIATDIDSAVLLRARNGCYSQNSLRDLPSAWQDRAFDRSGNLYSIKNVHKDSVRFLTMDIRDGAPAEHFHLIFCRNLAFTYFDMELQREILHMLYSSLEAGGVLIIGSHERLPASDLPLRKWHVTMPVYQKG